MCITTLLQHNHTCCRLLVVHMTPFKSDTFYISVGYGFVGFRCYYTTRAYIHHDQPDYTHPHVATATEIVGLHRRRVYE